jgi:hypothetical protein
MSRNSISKQPADDNYGFDLVASGSSGPWRVFIDETHAGPDKWFAQIQGPSVYFSFEIPSAKTIDRLVHFLGQSPQANPPSRAKKSDGSLLIGSDKRMPVTLIRDDEFADRCFLVFGGESGSIVRYSVAGNDLAKLTEAFRQARDELKSEGLLL